MDKDFRQNRSDEQEKGKPTVESTQVDKEKIFNSESILVCDKCNYKCTRSETLAKHVNTKHIHQIIKESKSHPKKNDGVCPVCKSDLKNLSLLIDHMHDSHVDNENDSEYYHDNMNILMDLHGVFLKEIDDSDYDED